MIRITMDKIIVINLCLIIWKLIQWVHLNKEKLLMSKIENNGIKEYFNLLIYISI